MNITISLISLLSLVQCSSSSSSSSSINPSTLPDGTDLMELGQSVGGTKRLLEDVDENQNLPENKRIRQVTCSDMKGICGIPEIERSSSYASPNAEIQKESVGQNSTDTEQVVSEAKTDTVQLPIEATDFDESICISMLLSAIESQSSLENFILTIKNSRQFFLKHFLKPKIEGKTIFEILLRKRCSNIADNVALEKIFWLLKAGLFETKLGDGKDAISLAILSKDPKLVELLLKKKKLRSNVSVQFLSESTGNVDILDMILAVLIENGI